MSNKGITLIELIVVVTIIGILAVALGFSFQGWIGKYKVESQTKSLYIDMMNTRARAMQRNRVHFLTMPSALSAGSYSIYEDTYNAADTTSNDGDEILQTGNDTLLPTYPKTVEYDMNWNGGGTTITFDKGGLVSPSGTLYAFADGDGNGIDDFDSDYSCIVISPTRINMGKCSGAYCANCDAR